MFKGFEYNKECRVLKDKSIYAEEHNVLCDFLATEHANVRLEYGNDREAKNAYASLSTWAKKNRKPLKLAQRKNYVFGFKTIED